MQLNTQGCIGVWKLKNEVHSYYKYMYNKPDINIFII